MSTKTEKLPFWERFSDRVNPILVKETRQALKGRGFIVTFTLLLGICWLISFIGTLTAGASLEYYSYAMTFFGYYFIPLAAAIGIVVPFLAYTSMLNERLDDTFEILSITSLTARRIVNGKLINALVQVLLFYSAISPFIAFTSLLQGFRLTPVVFIMTFCLFASICLCALGLLVSTLAQNRIVQGILSLLFVGFLIFCFSLLFTSVGGAFWLMPDDAITYLALGGVILLLIALTFLIREIAVAQITFEADNRSSGIRLVCTILILGFWLFLPILGGTLGWTARDWPAAIGWWTTISCLLMIPVLFFVCTEPVEMSRRVRKQVQSVAQTAGILAFPFLPGCARGYVYITVHLLPMLLICTLSYISKTSNGAPLAAAIFIVLYLIFYAGLASVLSQLLRQFFSNMRSSHIRPIFLISVSFAAIVPHAVIAFIESNQFARVEYSPLMVSSPLATLFHVADSADYFDIKSQSVAMILIVSSVLLFILNAGAIARSLTETFAARKSKSQPALRSTPTQVDASSGQPAEVPVPDEHQPVGGSQLGADA